MRRLLTDRIALVAIAAIAPLAVASVLLTGAVAGYGVFKYVPGLSGLVRLVSSTDDDAFGPSTSDSGATQLTAVQGDTPTLDERCTISILNRTARVQPNGCLLYTSPSPRDS